ncbi:MULTISPECIES: recombinase family protein [Bacillales]|uniref:recombinase family protein n=1 Tax=Bacillales TaxID=1385 RepID=UPI00034C9BC3|nr:MULTISPECIES: recombinase family protein [Bacillales]KMZ39877.1 DNA recombinase [Bacillus sp. FJAT-27238]
MRTAVYIRVSTEDQAREGFSIPAQREKLLSYVHSQGWEVQAIYADEGVSAKDTKRPALSQLLRDIRTGEIDVVLVYRLDRLTRSVLDLYQLLQEFDRHAVHFKSCTEVYDTTTAIGRLFITLVAALAQWERENLAERVKLGMSQMARERKRPGGPAPFGYNLVQGTLVVNQREAAGVRSMFERYDRGESPRQIAEWANHSGLRGKNGASWSASAVLRLLKNPVYHGALRWNYTDADQQRNAPEEWIIEEATHPAIIDQSCFLRVQERMSDRGTSHPRVLSSRYLFSGLLYCSRCGSSMRGKTTTITGKGEKRYTHRYYLCKNKLAGTCDAPAIREDRLEKTIVHELMQHSPESIAALQEVVQTLFQTNSCSPKETGQELQIRRQRWEHAYEEGFLSLADLREKINTLERAAKERERTCSAFSSVERFDLDALSNWNLIWSYANENERRLLVCMLIQRVDVEATDAASGQKNREVCLRLLSFH